MNAYAVEAGVGVGGTSRNDEGNRSSSRSSKRALEGVGGDTDVAFGEQANYVTSAFATSIANNNSNNCNNENNMATTISSSSSSWRERYAISDDCLGSGSFAEVRIGVKVHDGVQVAIKQFKEPALSNFIKKDLNVAQNECDMCQIMAEKNIDGVVNYIEVVNDCQNNDHVIIMEHLSGGELFEDILRKRNYSERNAALVIRRILTILDRLHNDARVFHCDLKPENFVFKSVMDSTCTDQLKERELSLKMLDFGLSMKIENDFQFENGICDAIYFEKMGAKMYMAPETRTLHKFSRKSDVWSIGIIACVLVSGIYPFSEKDLDKQQRQICHPLWISQGFFPNIRQELSEGCRNFIQRLCMVDDARRPTAKEALQDPWLTNIDKIADKPFSSDYMEDLQKVFLSSKWKVTLGSILALNHWKKRTLQNKLAKEAQERLQKKPKHAHEPSNSSSSSNDIASGPTSSCKQQQSNVFEEDSAVGSSLEAADFNSVDRFDLTFSSEQLNLLKVNFINQIRSKAAVDAETKVAEVDPLRTQLSSDILRSGEVDFATFCEVCYSVNLGILAKQFVFDIFDVNKNGFVDYKEFLVTLSNFQEKNEDSIRFYFDLFDTNGDGHLSYHEFRLVLLPSSYSSYSKSRSKSNRIGGKSSSACGGGGADEGMHSSESSFFLSGDDGDDGDDEGCRIGLTDSRDVSIRERFNSIDTNSDGVLQYDEFKRWMYDNFDFVRDSLMPSRTPSLDDFLSPNRRN